MKECLFRLGRMSYRQLTTFRSDDVFSRWIPDPSQRNNNYVLLQPAEKICCCWVVLSCKVTGFNSLSYHYRNVINDTS